MNFKVLPVLALLVASAQAGIIVGKDGLLRKVGDAIGIKNLVNVDADARVNVLGQEVGIDGAIGIGEHGIGAHAGADASILGQKANVHADVLDGHAIDQHNHEVYTDSSNRQYVLQRQYINNKSVLVRKYLDNGQVYLAGAEEDSELQHKQIDDWRIYDRFGGWWDLRTRRYYNRAGQWISGRTWDRSLWERDNQGRLYDRDGGWWDRLTGRYYSPDGQWVRDRVVDPVQWKRYLERTLGFDRQQAGGWQEEASYVDQPRTETQIIYDSQGRPVSWQREDSYVDEPRRPGQIIYDNQGRVVGWQRDGSYIAVDEPRTETKVIFEEQGQPSGQWQRDGQYIIYDEPRRDSGTVQRVVKGDDQQRVQQDRIDVKYY